MIVTSKSLLIILKNGFSIIKNFPKINKERVCYVCIRKPYVEVQKDLKNSDKDNLVFIDVVSSQYQPVSVSNKRVLLNRPEKLDELKESILRMSKKNKSQLIIIDDLSELLLYTDNFDILHFLNDITRNDKDSKIILLIKKDFELRKENNKSLLTDAKMFADKVVKA